MKFSNALIVIPAYNEERSVGKTVSELKRLYPEIDAVVVNDGSTDRTAAVARQAGAKVLSHPFNLGYGAALQTGYKYAVRHGFDYIVSIDADGQHNPADVGALLTAAEEKNLDIVLGSRFLGPAKYRNSIFRGAGVTLFRFLVRLTTGQTITDPTTGFQALRKNAFSVFIDETYPGDYPDADIIIMMSRAGFRVGEIGVTMWPNAEGKSMHGNPVRVLYYMFKLLLSIALTLSRKPPKRNDPL